MMQSDRVDPATVLGDSPGRAGVVLPSGDMPVSLTGTQA